MANPSLKAKIEAAKSALESGQAGTPNDDASKDTTTLKTALDTAPETKLDSSGSSAAALDMRITSLETKLAENQRDLYVLVGKIREITRLQNDAPQNNAPEAISSDSLTTIPRLSRTVAITIAMLLGIIIGTSYFFATDYLDQFFLSLPIWTTQFVDFVSGLTE